MIPTGIFEIEERYLPMIIQALRFEADCYLGRVYTMPNAAPWHTGAAQQRLDLADQLEAHA